MNELEEYERKTVDCLAEGDEICWALGLAGETGEVVELIKKRHYHGNKDKKGDITNERILNEAGDILWYLTALLHSQGYTILDCIKANTQKLAKRHPTGKFTIQSAQQHLDEQDVL